MNTRHQITDDMIASDPLIMNRIAEATGEPLHSVRAFFGSEHGRNFAQDVLMKMEMGRKHDDAVQAAVDLWMETTIGPGTSRQCDIPLGLPWLKAFVIQAALDGEVQGK